MVEVKEYYLPPTDLVPNSPQPLLHYTGLQMPTPVGKASDYHDLFQGNGWRVQWIFRYGPTQRSHFHSNVHECMAVLSGSATIRFGVADTSPDLDANTAGPAREDGGVEIEARAGDVFLLPAGTAHKTFNTSPQAEFSLLTPGGARRIAADDVRTTLDNVQLSGFTMIGAYPENNSEWDSLRGGERAGEYEKVWAVARPDLDPVLGKSEDGICGLWKQ